jgi:hypothetical protein
MWNKKNRIEVKRRMIELPENSRNKIIDKPRSIGVNPVHPVEKIKAE